MQAHTPPQPKTYAPLYLQLEGYADQNPQYIIIDRVDLRRDQQTLATAQPDDRFIWFIWGFGTLLIPCPVTAVAQMLRSQEATELPTHGDVRSQLRLNETTLQSHIKQCRELDRGTFLGQCFLLHCQDEPGHGTIEYLTPDDAISQMRSSRWQAFLDWKRTVESIVSTSALEMADSQHWYNWTSLGWTTLDWIKKYQTMPQCDTIGESTQPAVVEIIDLMQKAWQSE